MTCPVCGEKTIVQNTAHDCECIYRRRKCIACGYLFTTTEQESNDTEILLRLRRKQRNETHR